MNSASGRKKLCLAVMWLMLASSDDAMWGQKRHSSRPRVPSSSQDSTSDSASARHFLFRNKALLVHRKMSIWLCPHQGGAKTKWRRHRTKNQGVAGSNPGLGSNSLLHSPLLIPPPNQPPFPQSQGGELKSQWLVLWTRLKSQGHLCYKHRPFLMW